MPNHTTEVLMDHAIVSHGMSVDSPDGCLCGASLHPVRRTTDDGFAEEIGISRRRAFAEHIATISEPPRYLSPAEAQEQWAKESGLPIEAAPKFPQGCREYAEYSKNLTAALHAFRNG